MTFPALPLAVAITIFAGLSLTCAVTSEGFLEADSCTHYLFARFALQEPHYLINIWGRPLCTSLYALPAALAGRIGVQITSLLLAIICALLSQRIARLQGYRWPVLALIFTLAQPLVFLHSFSELTELPFATLIGVAFLAYRLRWFAAMALLVGLSPLGRPEGFGFIGLALVALVAHRKWMALPVLLAPLIGWNYLGWDMYGREGHWWRWLIEHWPYATQSLYRSGNVLHFVILLPAVVSPILFPATLLGIWRSFADGIQKGDKYIFLRRKINVLIPILVIESYRHMRRDHVARCQALIALLPLLILIGHSLLYWLGKMASSGEIRYLLVVAPLWGLLSAKGWEWVFARFGWHRPLRWAAVAALAPILIHFYYQVLPLVLADDWHRAREVADWYQRSPLRERYPYLSASHPGVFYFLDISPSDKTRVQDWTREMIQRRPPGTLLIWDPMYSIFNSDSGRSAPYPFIEKAGWEQIGAEGDWRIFVSE